MRNPIDPNGVYFFTNPQAGAGYMEYEVTSVNISLPLIAIGVDRTNIAFSFFLPRIRNTIEMLSLCNHPNIQTYFDSILIPDPSNASAPGHYFIILERDNNNVFSKIEDGTQLTEGEAQLIFSDLIEAVNYLHQDKFNIAHLDIRPENVFYSETEKVYKLSHFFRAKHAPDSEPFKGGYGTPQYQAPEIFKTHVFNGKKADVWACGIFFLTILLGKVPVEIPKEIYKKETDSSKPETLKRVAEQVSRLPGNLPRIFSAPVQRVLLMLLDPDPCKRRPISDVFNDPWIAEGRMKSQNRRLQKR